MPSLKFNFILCIGLLIFACQEPEVNDVPAAESEKEERMLLDLAASSDSIEWLIRCNDTSGNVQFLYWEDLCMLYGERAFQPLWLDELGLKPGLDSFLTEFEGSLLSREPAFDMTHMEAELESIRFLKDSDGEIPVDLAVKLELTLSDWLAWFIDKQSKGILDQSWQNAIGWHINDSISDEVLSGLKFLSNSNFNSGLVLMSDLAGDFPGTSDFEATYKYWNKKESDSATPPTLSLEEGEKIEIGYSGPKVQMVKERLAWIDYSIDSASINNNTYDSLLLNEVVRFQTSHGLYPDGVIGMGTAASLNLNPRDYINLLRVNQERRRWMLPETADYFVYVNIPEFQLRLYRNDSLLFESKVVTGKISRQTPVFMAKMSYLELNPTWTIPPTILSQDVLPQLLENTDYLKNKNIGVYTTDGQSVHPDSVNWSSYSSKSLPYKLRQASGWSNSLGVIKFMFPNKYYVYIHDTPDKSYFSYGNRARSSGCIRIADPRDFAGFLLKGDTAWTPEKLVSKLGGKNQKISLENQPTVYLLYFTATFDETRGLQYFQDVYGKDALILSKLDSSLSYQQTLMLRKEAKGNTNDYSADSESHATAEASNTPEAN